MFWTIVIVLVLYYFYKQGEKQNVEKNNNEVTSSPEAVANKEVEEALYVIRKSIEIAESPDFKKWDIGLTREEILKIDKGLDSILGTKFEMSEPFCKAWADKLKLILPYNIHCELRNELLYSVNFSGSTADSTTIPMDLKNIVKYLNSKYDKPNSVDLDLSKLDMSDVLHVGIWENTEVEIFLSVYVFSTKKLYEYSIGLTMRPTFSNQKFLNAPSGKKKISVRNIDWQTISIGFPFDKIKEIDEYAEYESNTRINLSKNYVRSLSKSLGLSKADYAYVDQKIGLVDGVFLTSKHCKDFEDLITDLRGLKEYYKQKYPIIMSENSVYDETAWQDNKLEYCWLVQTSKSQSDGCCLISLKKVEDRYYYSVSFS